MFVNCSLITKVISLQLFFSHTCPHTHLYISISSLIGYFGNLSRNSRQHNDAIKSLHKRLDSFEQSMKANTAIALENRELLKGFQRLYTWISYIKWLFDFLKLFFTLDIWPIMRKKLTTSFLFPITTTSSNSWPMTENMMLESEPSLPTFLAFVIPKKLIFELSVTLWKICYSTGNTFQSTNGFQPSNVLSLSLSLSLYIYIYIYTNIYIYIYILIYFFIYFISLSSEKTSGEGFVPFGFCHLLRMTLTRLTSTGALNPTLVTLPFWKLWPTKFRSICNYERRKLVS